MRSETRFALTFIICVALMGWAIGEVSAEVNEYAGIAPVRQGDVAILKQTCGTCSYVNVSVYYPNGSIAISNTGMSSDGGGRWTYSFANTDDLGRYDYPTCGNIEGVHTCSLTNAVPYFEVTYTGDKPSQEQIYIYIIGLIFLVLIVFGIYYIITTLPSKDSTDESGSIIQIVQLKHLRNVLWMIIWVISLAAIFILSNMGLAYLPSNAMLGNLFFVLWRVAFYFTIVGVPVYFCWIIYKVFKDNETKRMIERGVEIKTP